MRCLMHDYVCADSACRAVEEILKRLDKAIKTINKLESSNVQKEQLIRVMRKQIPRWISADKQEPEKNVPVLAQLAMLKKDGSYPVREAIYTDNGWYVPGLTLYTIVDWWMPMPK